MALTAANFSSSFSVILIAHCLHNCDWPFLLTHLSIKSFAFNELVDFLFLEFAFNPSNLFQSGKGPQMSRNDELFHKDSPASLYVNVLIVGPIVLTGETKWLSYILSCEVAHWLIEKSIPLDLLDNTAEKYQRFNSLSVLTCTSRCFYFLGVFRKEKCTIVKPA